MSVTAVPMLRRLRSLQFGPMSGLFRRATAGFYSGSSCLATYILAAKDNLCLAKGILIACTPVLTGLDLLHSIGSGLFLTAGRPRHRRL